MLTTDSVSDAIIAANSQMGVVIGENQQYVWKRSRKTAQAAFNDIVVGEEDSGAGSIAQCVNAILEKRGNQHQRQCADLPGRDTEADSS